MKKAEKVKIFAEILQELEIILEKNHPSDIKKPAFLFHAYAFLFAEIFTENDASVSLNEFMKRTNALIPRIFRPSDTLKDLSNMEKILMRIPVKSIWWKRLEDMEESTRGVRMGNKTGIL
jgi:hypothetical protein